MSDRTRVKMTTEVGDHRQEFVVEAKSPIIAVDALTEAVNRLEGYEEDANE